MSKEQKERDRQMAVLRQFLGEQEANEIICNIVALYPTLLEAMMERILKLEKTVWITTNKLTAKREEDNP